MDQDRHQIVHIGDPLLLFLLQNPSVLVLPIQRI